MIGSKLVQTLVESGYTVIGIDIKSYSGFDGNYSYYSADLGDIETLRIIFKNNQIDKVIHLAALAHIDGVHDLSWETYYHVNVECSGNIFTVAKENDLPVLFISTVDVLGFQKEMIDGNTECHPVTVYGKSKLMAEQMLKKICKIYDVYRFSPVYTNENKRDIQKRYYLNAPVWAYQIGKGSEYEVLNIDKAVEAMASWCTIDPNCTIKIIKDNERLRTVEAIKKEKISGKAKHVIYFPRWIVVAVYFVLLWLTGKNKFTYLLFKAVNPYRCR